MRLIPWTILLSTLGCVDQAHFTPVGEISLSGPTDTLVVRSRGTVEIPFSVVRGTGQDGEISFLATGLPSGIELEPYELPASATQGAVTLRATSPALREHNRFTLIAEGKGGKTASIDVDLQTIGAIGDLDTSFGNEGRLSIPANVYADTECLVARLPSGKLLVNTSPMWTIGVTRIHPDGRIDTSFGASGSVLINSFGADLERRSGTRVHMLPTAGDAVFVSVGADNPATSQRFDATMWFKLTENGSLDSTFGSGGFVRTNEFAIIEGLAAAPNNELYVLRQYIGLGITLSRFDSSGRLVLASAVVSPSPVARTLMVQADGKAVVTVTGYSQLRFNNALQLDLDFGNNGMIALPGTPLAWAARSDGGFIGVGVRYDYPTTGVTSGFLWQVDSLWRTSPGFGTNGLSIDNVNFMGVVEDGDHGSLVTWRAAGSAQLMRIDAMGQLDRAFGVNGYKHVASLTGQTSYIHVSPAGPFHAVVSFANQGQSCELIKIWR